ncbi:MAG: GAF domain-containing protein [Planctomycetes bacterium]|nr:GAF domain-containing protein [Planctomycetota bacterium]
MSESERSSSDQQGLGVEQLINALPLEAMVLDQHLRVIYEMRPKDGPGLKGRFLGEILDEGCLHQHNLIEVTRNCMNLKQCYFKRHVKLRSLPSWNRRNCDITISPLDASGEPMVLFCMRDVTHERQLEYELKIIQEFGFYMVSTLELNRLLFLILTGITAGPALGFNRAMIFMLNKAGNIIEGCLGVGPSSPEEAGRIWSQVTERKKTIKDFLKEFDDHDDPSLLPMTRLAKELSVELSNEKHILVKTFNAKKVFHVLGRTLDPQISALFRDNFENIEFITCPMIAGDETIGVIIADNRYNWQSIDDKSKEFLALFANLAGVALQNATRHEQLKDNLEKVKDATRLLTEANRKITGVQQYVTVGKMASFVSHEIRNPLVTIGGFARSSLKNLDNPKRIERNASIIVNEVARLEEMLSDMLDFMREQKPDMQQGSIGEIIEEVSEMSEYLQANNVKIETRIREGLPYCPYDRKLLKQALINLVKNAVSFSPPESVVLIEAELVNTKVQIRISDQGPGIPPENRGKLFEPFFTTKDAGSGLGLTITKRIIDGHRGRIWFQSGADKGTTVVIELSIS